MKKILALSVILAIAFAAASFAQAGGKKITTQVTTLKVQPAPVVPTLAPLPAPAKSSMPISVKAGLAGGAGRIGVVVDREIKEKVSLTGELGYAIGNSYSILTAGVGGIMALRDNLAVGLEVTYSSYSEKVKLSFPTIDITEKSGVGGELFVKMTRDKLYGQLGYDTRLGGVAEVGLVVRM